MNKKIIIGIIAAIVVIGGTVGTVLGVQAYNTNKEYEELANNVTECEKMIQNINYCYSEETDECKQARQNDLNTLKTYKEEIESKDMTDEQKSEFSEFCKNLKKKYEDDKTQTKVQFDAVVASKDSHTDEGYYIDEFNNEWNEKINKFNEFYNNGQYFEAFKVVLDMQKRLNAYVTNKGKEAADKTEAERQQNEASQASGKKSNSSSSASGKKNNTGGNESAGDNGSSSNEGTTASTDNRRQLTPEEQQKDAQARSYFNQLLKNGESFNVSDGNGNFIREEKPQ